MSGLAPSIIGAIDGAIPIKACFILSSMGVILSTAKDLIPTIIVILDGAILSTAKDPTQ